MLTFAPLAILLVPKTLFTIRNSYFLKVKVGLFTDMTKRCLIFLLIQFQTHSYKEKFSFSLKASGRIKKNYTKDFCYWSCYWLCHQNGTRGKDRHRLYIQNSSKKSVIMVNQTKHDENIASVLLQCGQRKVINRVYFLNRCENGNSKNTL